MDSSPTQPEMNRSLSQVFFSWYLEVFWRFLKIGVALFIPSELSDFPWNKLSSELGIPPWFWKPPIGMNFKTAVQSAYGSGIWIRCWSRWVGCTSFQRRRRRSPFPVGHLIIMVFLHYVFIPELHGNSAGKTHIILWYSYNDIIIYIYIYHYIPLNTIIYH